RGAATSRSMISAPLPPIRSRCSRVTPSAGGLGGMQGERRLLDFFPDECFAEVFRPALADGLRFRAIGEHQEGHVRRLEGCDWTLLSTAWGGWGYLGGGADSRISSGANGWRGVWRLRGDGQAVATRRKKS